MDFSMKLFTMLSFLLFVSMAADVGNTLVVDAQSDVPCNQTECSEACGSMGLYGCCPCCLQPGPCKCQTWPGCPRLVQVEIPNPKDMMIKEPVA